MILQRLAEFARGIAAFGFFIFFCAAVATLLALVFLSFRHSQTAKDVQ